MSELITFTLIAALLVISPGPNSVLIIKTASSHGKYPALINILGLTSATFFHGFFSIFGISALLLQSAEMFFIIKMIGAAYLFYIGVKALIESFKKPETRRDSFNRTDSLKETKTTTLRAFFFEGFITQLLNPKVSLFYLAAFPQFTTPDSFSPAGSLLLVSIHAVIIALWFVAMTFAIDKMKARSSQSRVGVWVQRLSGSVMIYFSSLIVTQK
ncbi:MAG: LysE family translocator [Cellvibrionaceae bacterium]